VVLRRWHHLKTFRCISSTILCRAGPRCRSTSASIPTSRRHLASAGLGGSDIPVKALGPSGLGFARAIFQTALSWRDSTQTALPGYRNRTAKVWMSRDEGGTNLFMTREAIAALALRGAIAGARLRTRFLDDGHWNRFRWLRLRTAISNIEKVRGDIYTRRGFDQDALSKESWLDTLKDCFGGRTANGPVQCYRPLPEFWPHAAELLNTFANAYRPPHDDAKNVMRYCTPEPSPVIRQVPRV